MIYRFRKEEKERLETVRQYLVQHLHEPVRMETLCSLAIMGRQKLNAGFVQQFQKPVREYLVMLRMEKARMLLQSSEESIGSIAAACGYQYQGSFSEAYKKYYGVLPRDGRRRGGPVDPS